MDEEETRRQARVTMNVSGCIFETVEATLERFPTTLLGNRRERLKYYNERCGFYFFDRNRLAFEAILYFYQSSGRLEKPLELQVDIFEEECRYFRLPKRSIEDMKFKENSMSLISTSNKVKKCKSRKITRFFWLWNLIDNPASSKYARIYAIFSVFLVMMSVVMTCLETLPSIRQHHRSSKIGKRNWFYVELTLNGFFLAEFLLRCLLAPDKASFIRHILNWFDLLAVIPYFISLSISKENSSLRVFRILRFFRIIRLFRITKYSTRLKLIGTIFASSLGDLKLLLLCLLLAVTFGASLLYFAELDSSSQFESIPQSLWWAIQTIVVLGYGDIVPVTLLGKLFASAFMVFGALTISLPVLSVVTRFTKVYGSHLKRNC